MSENVIELLNVFNLDVFCQTAFGGVAIEGLEGLFMPLKALKAFLWMD